MAKRKNQERIQATVNSRIDLPLQVSAYCTCALCIDELKAAGMPEAPATYSRLNVGVTPTGMQVWCVRHNVNVAHIEWVKA